MNGWIDEWMNRGMDGWMVMNGWMNGIDGRMDGWMDRCER